MKMFNKIKMSNVIIFGIVCLILSLYLFRAADGEGDKDSEMLPIGSVMGTLQGKTAPNQGFGLYKINNLDTLSGDEAAVISDIQNGNYEYEAYTSQIGLQGHLMIIAVKVLKNGNAVVQLFKILNCFLFAFVIMGIVLQIYKKYGLNFAIAFFVISFSAHWNVNFSRNLYWVEYTWFIPLFLGLFLLNHRKNRAFLYPLFLVAVLVKCLCGYEFLSVVMMGGIVFLIAEWIRDKSNRKEYTKDILIIGLMSILGFATAYLIQAYISGNGNIADGFSFMKLNLWSRRMSIMSSSIPGADEIMLESINAPLLKVVKMYLFMGLEGKLILISLLSAVFCCIYQRKILKKNNNFDISLLLVTFLGAISWLILAKPHSYIHTHINFVIWYMGFMQTCVYIVLNTVMDAKKVKLIIEKWSVKR